MPDVLHPTTMTNKPDISGFVLERTVKMMRLSFSRVLLMQPDLDVTIDQWVVLQILKKHHRLSQQELGDLTFKDAPTITRMIDLMAAKHMVTRIPDPNDRRKFIIDITETGLKKYSLIEPLVRAFREEAYEGIDHDELICMHRVLDKIFNNLSKYN